METVFITIHDLSLDARILYASDSVEDILGYHPGQIKGKSCWEYFHPDEIPFAKEVHGRGINLDKAAVLNYCQIKHKDGTWIGCECVFTVVYDVLVASTSIYKRSPRARQRALDGAGVRRIFSSSPRDPRYHMLSFISSKFYTEPKSHMHEPRAALFLNRYSRTSPIMFATKGVSSILGLSSDELIGKSFYYCIAQNCLKDAVRCLESAKGNDSIAYLRFWYRDPTRVQELDNFVLPDGHSSDDDDDEEGGVRLGPNRSPEPAAVEVLPEELVPPEQLPNVFANTDTTMLSPQTVTDTSDLARDPESRDSRTSSDNSTDLEGDAADAIFDPPTRLHHSESSLTPAEDMPETNIEIEAVVSCTSDGLIVIIRRARPLAPQNLGQRQSPRLDNGLFASPWAAEPVLPPHVPGTIPPEAAGTTHRDMEPASFMTAIREIAVFAWCLTGINGSLAEYARGVASGEAIPYGGMPVWDPQATPDPEAEKYNGFLPNTHRHLESLDNPYSPTKKDDDASSSEDEVLWRRGNTMPPWRRPARRGHEDAFGADGETVLDEDRPRRNRRRRV